MGPLSWGPCIPIEGPIASPATPYRTNLGHDLVKWERCILKVLLSRRMMLKTLAECRGSSFP